MGSDSPGTLLRSDSSSSFGSAYSDGYHLPSTGADSPLPRDISRSSSGLSNLVEVPIMGAGFDWPGKRPGPMNFDHSMLNTPANSNPNSPRGSEPKSPHGSEPKSPHGSEPSTSGSSGLSRSESEFSLNTGNLINGELERKAMNGITHTPGKHVLHTTVKLNQEDLAKGHKNVDEVIPAHHEPGSSYYPIASTLSDYPGGRQAAREIDKSVIEARWGGTTPQQTNGQVLSRSSSMESELRKPLPETNWDFTKNAAAPTGEGATGEAAAAKKKPALSKLQMAGLGTLAVGGAAAAILPIVLGSKDDSSNGDGSVQT